MLKHIDNFTQHPILLVSLWIGALGLHTLGKIQEMFIVISPELLTFTEWLSFIAAIIVSCCAFIGYAYKFYKWLKINIFTKK